MAEFYVGIMSGTSLDGADAVLVNWATGETLAFASRPFSPALRASLAELCAPGVNEIELAARAANELARNYAAVCDALLKSANIRNREVRAIGCHGQTVRHRPEQGFTVQIQNPALLAELTEISVVADFRSRDIAAGGQGAPLVPAFHDAIFRDASKARAIVNIGGIANITVLDHANSALGFDCGPGNVLMDYWIQKNFGKPFDESGNWAQGGICNLPLLERMLSECYFALSPPKSTGRELFNATWLDQHLGAESIAARDVQATLLSLTACTIADAIQRHFANCTEICICGGGAQNIALVKQLGSLLPRVRTVTTAALGMPPAHVEAAAFSWLAKQAIIRKETDLSLVTGAHGPRILGAIYPA